MGNDDVDEGTKARLIQMLEEGQCDAYMVATALEALAEQRHSTLLARAAHLRVIHPAV